MSRVHILIPSKPHIPGFLNLPVDEVSTARLLGSRVTMVTVLGGEAGVEVGVVTIVGVVTMVEEGVGVEAEDVVGGGGAVVSSSASSSSAVDAGLRKRI